MPSKIKELQILQPDISSELEITLGGSNISAGFPSPAEDFIEGQLDLNQYLIKHPSSTFFLRVAGDSMINAGINAGDILIVDRSITPVSGKIVIAIIDGELTVKRFSCKDGNIMLLPENDAYPPIILKGEQELMIWGVVTSVIRQL